jgi:hypothetical protein
MMGKVFQEDRRRKVWSVYMGKEEVWRGIG